MNSDRGLKFSEGGAFLKSPIFEGAITSATVVTYCSSTRIDFPFIVSAGTTEESFIDCGSIGYLSNTYVTNVFFFVAAAQMHGIKIRVNASEVKGNYYVASVALKWTGGPLQPPQNVQAENVETNAFVLKWSSPDDAETCRPLIWTNRVVGATSGTVVWQEAFTNAPAAKAGAVQAITPGVFNGYTDSPDESQYWKLDHVYPSVDAGAIRIGGTETNGWIMTPHLPGGEALTLHLRARRQDSSDGVDLPLRRNSEGTVTEIGTVCLTDEYQDFYLPVPVLDQGDHIIVHSTTNKKSTRVILDLLELRQGYGDGRLEADYLVQNESICEEEFSIGNLPLGEYYYAVEAVRGEDRALSSTGRVELVARTSPALSPAIRLSEMKDLNWYDDFDRIAALYPGNGNVCVWTNVVTLYPWQAWCDGVAPSDITRNRGAVANGGLYAYCATNDQISTYSLGMNVGSSANDFVVGVAFTNDQRVVLEGFSLAYEGRQFGFRNTDEQKIEVEWLVTNRLVSVAVDGRWRKEDRLTFTTPAVGRSEELKSGSDLPLGAKVSGALENAVLHEGEILLVRWKRTRVTNSAALAIDNVHLSFRKKDCTTVILIR